MSDGGVIDTDTIASSGDEVFDLSAEERNAFGIRLATPLSDGKCWATIAVAQRHYLPELFVK